MMMDAGSVDPGVAARAFFDSDVAPKLEMRCLACHGADRTGPAFLTGDVHETLLSWPALVELDDVDSSRILTKGLHEGPAWEPAEAAAVRTWIEMEAAARADDPEDPEDPRVYSTAAVPPDGFVVLELDEMGIPGAALTFIGERTAAGIVLSDVQVSAGRTGARLEHPVVVTWQDGHEPEPDAVDRFAGIELRVSPFESQPLADRIILVGFPTTGGRVSFLFDDAGPFGEPSGGDGGMAGGDGGTGLPGGCMNVMGFTENAQPPLSMTCFTCHGGSNPTARMAVDLSMLRDLSMESQTHSCNEILARVDRDALSRSPLFLAPDPASGVMHPFKFMLPGQIDAFRSSVLLWLATE
jgi:hypothetical protein